MALADAPLATDAAPPPGHDADAAPETTDATLDAGLDEAAVLAAAKKGLAPDEEGAEGTPEGKAKADEAAAAKPKSPSWDAYHRKSKAVREKAAQLQAAESDLRQRQALWAKDAEELTQLRSLRASAKEDPLKVLEAFGLDLSEINLRALRAGSPEEQSSMLAKKLAALETERAAEKEAARRATEQAQQGATRSAATAFIKSKADDKATHPELHMFVRLNGLDDVVESVPKIAAAMHQQSGRWPGDDEMVRELERRAALVNDDIRSSLGLPKIQNPPAEQGAGKPPKAGPNSSRQSPKTLSHAATSQSSGQDRPDETDAENKEKVKRILRQLRDAED